jgi:hypothetical protein
MISMPRAMRCDQQRSEGGRPIYRTSDRLEIKREEPGAAAQHPRLKIWKADVGAVPVHDASPPILYANRDAPALAAQRM